MAPKVPVFVRVELGKKHHQSGRMHEAEVALSLVVSDALERAEPEIAAGKLTTSTVKCFRTTEFSGTGTVLDNEDLGETTVGILRDMFGCNIKVLATAEDSPATPGLCLIVVGALAPFCFLFSVFQNARPPATPRRLGPPLTERSKRDGQRRDRF